MNRALAVLILALLMGSSAVMGCASQPLVDVRQQALVCCRTCGAPVVDNRCHDPSSGQRACVNRCFASLAENRARAVSRRFTPRVQLVQPKPAAFAKRRLAVCCVSCHMTMQQTAKGRLCRTTSQAAVRCVSGCIKWLVGLRRY